MGHFLGRGQRMNHIADPAYPIDRIEDHDGMRHIGQTDRDDIPGLKTDFAQTGRRPVDLVKQLFVTDMFAHKG